MNANLVMAYVDEIPTMVKGDKDYIRMLIEQAVKRMEPPLTREEEDQRKADDERVEKSRIEYARKQDERKHEIAVKEAERDKEIAEGFSKTATDNLEAIRTAQAAGRAPGNPTLSGSPVSRDQSDREAEEIAGKAPAGQQHVNS
jgi:hypothetical protein